MTNLTDLTVDSLTISSTVQHAPTHEHLDADGAINIKCGIATLAKLVAGVITMTLANPTATTDDYKVLTIVNAQAQANVIGIAGSGFGNGGANYVKCTFTGALGDSLQLMAYQGYWYVIGGNSYTLSA